MTSKDPDNRRIRKPSDRWTKPDPIKQAVYDAYAVVKLKHWGYFKKGKGPSVDRVNTTPVLCREFMIECNRLIPGVPEEVCRHVLVNLRRSGWLRFFEEGGFGSQVYFFHCPKAAVVKVGYAQNVPKRMESCQTWCPYPVVLLGTIPGDRQVEKQIHDHLYQWRALGEWFAYCDKVKEIIDSILADGWPIT